MTSTNSSTHASPCISPCAGSPLSECSSLFQTPSPDTQALIDEAMADIYNPLSPSPDIAALYRKQRNDGKVEFPSKMQNVVTAIGNLLTTISGGNTSLDARSYAKFPPVVKYVSHLVENFHCSPESCVLAVVYLYRFLDTSVGSNTVVNYNTTCIHLNFLTALVLAVKFHEDTYFSSSHYAQVGGIATDDLNVLVSDFAFQIDFNLTCNKEEFDTYTTLCGYMY